MLFQSTGSAFPSQLKSSRSVDIAHGLSPQVVTNALEKLNLEFRDRVFNPFITLFAFLSQILSEDSSCRYAVASVASHLVSTKRKPCSLGTSSFCKAKARLPLPFFETVSKAIADHLESKRGSGWGWKHGEVKIVDGTGLSMPDTKENLTEFPKAQGSFPIVRLLAVFSLTTGGFIDGTLAAWCGKGVGELSLLRKLWVNFNKGDTLLGDGLYSNYWVLAAAIPRGVAVVAEFNKRSWQRINCKIPDQTIEIKKPFKPKWMSVIEYNQAPTSIKVRIVKLSCAPNGFRAKTKFILTTHLDAIKVPAEDILELYKKRWQVELNLRSLKTLLGMDTLKGQSPGMVKKEIWTHIIAYNLIRIKMADAGKAHKKIPTNLSFRATQQMMSILRLLAIMNIKVNDLDQKILELLATQAVGQRPDRYEPRAIKSRKKNFAFLRGTRADARKKLHKKYKLSKNAAP